MSSRAAGTSDSARAGGHWALVAVQFCFGLFPVFGVWALEDGAFDPRALAAWRMVVGAVVLFGIAWAVHGRRAIPAPRDLPWLLLGSILGVTANMVLYLEGLKRSTPTNAALMMGLIPVFTFAIAAWARVERPTTARLVGVALALFGASMRFWNEAPDLLRAHTAGNLLMAANAACYSGYFVVSRPLLARLPPLVVIAWVFVLAVPFVPVFARGSTFVPEHASARAWGALAFTLVFPTVLAYLLNIVALARLSASTTAIYVYAQPLITATASYLVHGEALTTGMLVSAVFVFPGIWLVARKPPALEDNHGNAART